MEKINDYIDELKRFDTNVKKHKNRVYSSRYKVEKLDRLSLLKKEVEEYSETLGEKCKSLVVEFQGLYNNALLLIQNLNIKDIEEKIEENIEEEIEDTEIIVESNMAHFDISVVGKNLQVFKGSYEALEDFLVQTELLHDLLRTEDREIFIKYVFNFKLTAQVRSIIGRANRPVTFSDLKGLLITAYPNPNTLQQVLTKFGTLRQGNSDITSFREKIALLSDQLSTFEIRSLENPTQREKDAIYKMSDSMSLNVFMKGVNQEFQDLLIASNPKTLNEAVEKCITAERSRVTNSIFRVGNAVTRNNSRDNNQYNNRNYRNYNNNRGYNPQYNQNYHRDNSMHSNGNTRYNNTQYNNRFNSGNRNNSSNGYNNSNSQRNSGYREDRDNFNRNRNNAAFNTNRASGRERQGN